MSELEKIQQRVDENRDKAKKEAAPARLIAEPRVFEADTMAHITSTSDLTKIINETLLSVFRDYVGCRMWIYDGTTNICQDMTLASTMIPGNLYVDLYFDKQPDGVGGKIPNLELVGNDNSDTMARLQRVTGFNGGHRVYNVTKTTKETLTEFLSGYMTGVKNQNLFWPNRIREEATQTTFFNNQQKVVVRVVGISVDALMGLVYGSKTNVMDPEEPIRYDYHCLPVCGSMKNRMTYYNGFQPGPNGQAVPIYNNEYVIQILRNDRSIIAHMQEAIGYNTYPVSTSQYVPARQ